jgi:DMSO reductase family type II enzyme heme b subunit
MSKQSKGIAGVLRMGLGAYVASAVILGVPAHAVIAEHSPPDSKSEKGQPAAIAVNAVSKSISTARVLNPYDAAWRSAPAQSLPLYQQSVVQPYGGGSVNAADVRVIRLENGLAVRLTWSDSTRDDAANASQFKDGVAVEFPINSSKNSPLAMGHAGSAVNIWHWSADMEGTSKARGIKDRERLESRNAAAPVEDLVAAGFYNRERKSVQSLGGHGVWRDGEWSVVFIKPFTSDDGNSPAFESEKEIPMAIAIWNGSAGDRLGLKSISNWALLRLP